VTYRLLIPAVLFATAAAAPVGGNSQLSIRVSPANSMAPAHLQVLVRMTPDVENRKLTIVADSGDFYRASEIQLDGDSGPRSVLVAFRELPGGEYHVSAALFNSRGDRRAVAQQQVMVLSMEGR
jgi:hypothetical protein